MSERKLDHKDILYSNARLLDPASNLDKVADILVIKGKIADIGKRAQWYDIMIIQVTPI